MINPSQRAALYALGTSVCLPGDLRIPIREQHGLSEDFLKTHTGVRRWNLETMLAAFGDPDIFDFYHEGKLVDATWGFAAYGRGQEQVFLVEAFTVGSRVDLLAPVRLFFAVPVLRWLHAEHVRFENQHGTKT